MTVDLAKWDGVPRRQFENYAVPFIKLGNRRALTDKQLVEQPWLKDFVDRFRQCFEYDPHRCIWVYWD